MQLPRDPYCHHAPAAEAAGCQGEPLMGHQADPVVGWMGEIGTALHTFRERYSVAKSSCAAQPPHDDFRKGTVTAPLFNSLV